MPNQRITHSLRNNMSAVHVLTEARLTVMWSWNMRLTEAPLSPETPSVSVGIFVAICISFCAGETTPAPGCVDKSPKLSFLDIALSSRQL